VLTTENSGSLVEVSRKNKGVGIMAKVKIISATMIKGKAVAVGETVELDERLAKDLLRRGRAVPAGEQTKSGEGDDLGSKDDEK
jgi:hypothetical protein